MKHVLFILFYFLSAFIIAQDNYNVDLIPAKLKENADAVIRLDEKSFTILNPGKAIIKEHLSVTVFNERGEEKHGVFYIHYDKFTKINSLEGTLYDATGKVIQRLKKSNIKDVGIGAFEDEISDTRYQLAGFGKKSYPYPYTIEFISEEETKNMMFYPEWEPMSNEHTSVEKSTFSIIHSPSINFRFKEINIVNPGIIYKGEKEIQQTWTLENTSAYDNENYKPHYLHPEVITAPVEFEVEGYKGNFNTWSDFGKFYFQLNNNRGELPANIKTKVKELTDGETSTLKKIEKLYDFLQANTRYISIQLGIGGWQTREAKEVGTKGYGDCKALSNYMVALLKEAGINSYVALIHAGDDAPEIIEDFPHNQFNHVIACVPVSNDTVWLECTSQFESLGYQGDFTGNRMALLITPEGGKLVNTITYNPSDNLLSRNAKVTVDESGNAIASVVTDYKGIQQKRLNYVMHSYNSEKQKQWLQKSINISSFELKSFSFSEKKGRIPAITEKLELAITRKANVSGTRFFITPNLIPDFFSQPVIKGTRKSPLFLNPNEYNIQDIDTIRYQLPPNYEIESMPDPVKIQSPFGEYSLTITFADNNLIYCRKVIVKGGTYPAATYPDWSSFVKKVRKNDNLDVVFVKKKD